MISSIPIVNDKRGLTSHEISIASTEARKLLVLEISISNYAITVAVFSLMKKQTSNYEPNMKGHKLILT